MNIWGKALHLFRWKVEITAPRRNKCVICVAPHTSNLDFILGLAAYQSLGRKANFLMKSFWFFWPMKYLLRHFGGIPVYRRKKGEGRESLTHYLVDLFKRESYVNLAVTPEGTRSRVDKWKTGFLYVAYGAEVPIQLGVIDYGRRLILIAEEYTPTGDVEADMRHIKEYYSQFPEAAKHPDQFST